MEQELRREIFALKAENDALRAQLEGDLPRATAWLQNKIWRQQRALDVLNRRVTSQRVALRTIEELGRGLTKEEYDAARERLHPQTKERVLEHASLVG